MKAPIGSLLAVVGVTAIAVSSTPFLGAARALEVLADPPPGACGAAIALVETALNRALSSGHPAVGAPESVDAMLHRQPTIKSIASAQAAAVKRVEDSIAAARKLRAEGNRAECIVVMEEVDVR